MDRTAEFEALVEPDSMARLKRIATRYLHRTQIRDLDDVIYGAIAYAWEHQDCIHTTVEGYVVRGIARQAMDWHRRYREDPIGAPTDGYESDKAPRLGLINHWSKKAQSGSRWDPKLDAHHENEKLTEENREERLALCRSLLKGAKQRHWDSMVERGFVSATEHKITIRDSRVRMSLFKAMGTPHYAFRMPHERPNRRVN
jgi:hypothetical protein